MQGKIAKRVKNRISSNIWKWSWRSAITDSKRKKKCWKKWWVDVWKRMIKEGSWDNWGMSWLFLKKNFPLSFWWKVKHKMQDLITWFYTIMWKKLKKILTTAFRLWCKFKHICKYNLYFVKYRICLIVFTIFILVFIINVKIHIFYYVQ